MLQRARASRLIAGVAAAEPAILLLIAPALLFPSPRRVLIALVVPLIWTCHRLSGGSFIPATPLNTSIAALLAMGMVSLSSPSMRHSAWARSGLFLGVALYWAFVRWISTGPRLRVAVGGFLLAGAGLTLVALAGTNWIDKFAALGAVQARLPRIIRGLPGAEEGFQPNAVAGCLVLFIPLQIALLLRAARAPAAHALAAHVLAPNALAPNVRTRTTRRTELAFHAMLLGLTAGTLILTQSRGAWAGLLVGALAFLVWHSRQTRRVAALLAGALVLVAVTFGPARVLDFAISQSGSGMASNVSGRMELWSRAIDGVQDFPLTGMGMNVFRRVQPILYPTFSTSPDIDVTHAHNHLLQVALDLGLPGLIAYLAIWIGTGVLLVQVHRRSDDPLQRTVASGLGAGLVAHFAFGMTDAIALGAKVGVLFWMALALAVALHNVTHRPKPT